MIFRFKKENGAVVWIGRTFQSFLVGCRSGAYIVDVKRDVPSRTTSQNKLYWLWLTCVSDETGQEKESLHSIFTALYLSYVIRWNGDFIRVVRSTSSLDTVQFTDYLDKIQAYCAEELSIQLPIPDDPGWGEFESYYKNKI